ncbi:MAG: protein kinase [Chlamydiales bacterium]|nr:protein kinase [Chlamydiales bacterium]
MKITNNIKSIDNKNSKPSISIAGRIAVVALSLTIIGLPLAYLLHKHLKGRVQATPPAQDSDKIPSIRDKVLTASQDNEKISSTRDKVLALTQDTRLLKELSKIIELGEKHLYEEPSPLKRFKRKDTGLNFSVTPVVMGTDKHITGFIAHAKGDHGKGSFGKCKKAYLFTAKNDTYDVQIVNLKIGRKDEKSKYKFGHLARSENIKHSLFTKNSTNRIEQKAMAFGLIAPEREFTLTPLYKSDLKNHIPKNIDEVIQIGKDICEGLQFIHSQNKMHRDVKPANILIDDQARAILADHDLVTHVKKTFSSFHGTPVYMAPESRALHRKKQLPASDMFALGLILLDLRAKVLENATKNMGLSSLAKEIRKKHSPLEDNFQRSVKSQHNDYLIKRRDLLGYAMMGLGANEGMKESIKFIQLELLIRSLLKDYQERPTADQAFEELSAISS